MDHRTTDHLHNITTMSRRPTGVDWQYQQNYIAWFLLTFLVQLLWWSPIDYWQIDEHYRRKSSVGDWPLLVFPWRYPIKSPVVQSVIYNPLVKIFTCAENAASPWIWRHKTWTQKWKCHNQQITLLLLCCITLHLIHIFHYTVTIVTSFVGHLLGSSFPQYNWGHSLTRKHVSQTHNCSDVSWSVY